MTSPATSEGAPEGFARGWFVVAFSDELRPGEGRPLRYFARDLVLFRTEEGAPHVLDAHCPHLGAHLGHGGRVEGGAIRCPFHAWRFDGSGRCVEVPYASRVPPRAQVRSWPVLERNRMIFVWHDPAGGAPEYEIPAIEGLDDPAWGGWSHSMITARTQPWEIVENVADRGHFLPVHDTKLESFENVFAEHTAVQRATGWGFGEVGGKFNEYAVTATYYGPAYQVSEMGAYVPFLLVNAHTPIDEGSLHLRFATTTRPGTIDPRGARIAQVLTEAARDGFLQDIRIWEHKRYVSRPTLCDGDGPISELRQWYAQFYRKTVGPTA